MLQAEATPAFPVLGDMVVASLIESVTINRIKAMGTDPLRRRCPSRRWPSAPPAPQGWKTCPCPRAHGGGWTLWLRVLKAGSKLLED